MTWTDLDLTWTDLVKSPQSGSLSDLDTDTVSPFRGNRSSTSQDTRTLGEESGSIREAPDLSKSWIDFDALGPAAIASIDPPIVIACDWRDVVAAWPHTEWTRWRRYAGEFLESLDRPPTASEIRGAEHASYDFIIWAAEPGGPTP